MSATRPSVSSAAATTTRYPISTHSTVPVSDTPNAWAIDGSAMFTIELSRVVMKAAVPDSARTVHLLASWMWSGGIAETTSECSLARRGLSTERRSGDKRDVRRARRRDAVGPECVAVAHVLRP